MTIRIIVAGATGWAGSLITRSILESDEFQLAGAIARQEAGKDVGEVLGMPAVGVRISPTLEAALQSHGEVLIDYTHPSSVKARTLSALEHGMRVVIGTSGLTAEDFDEIGEAADRQRLGVIAAGNFWIAAA